MVYREVASWSLAACVPYFQLLTMRQQIRQESVNRRIGYRELRNC